eukprot:COSAG06_NODE_52483_length_305_cov_0.902913_1_plen_43_part_10
MTIVFHSRTMREKATERTTVFAKGCNLELGLAKGIGLRTFRVR